MSILVLTWEYPPNIVGGMARHVHDLVHAMAEPTTQLHVITALTNNLPPEERAAEHLTVHRVALHNASPDDFETAIHHLNFAMVAKAIEISRREKVDLVHVHDWLAAFAGVSLKRGLQVPLIATIHATEEGRNHGIHTDQQRYIHNIEWWLTYEAWRVIVCSEYMRDEVKRVFALPEDKVRVVYNGVDARRFRQAQVPPGFRESLAAPDERIVFFVGRMVREKGVHLLIEAAPKVLTYMPNTKFIIAGGGYADHHKRRVAELGLHSRFYFLGFVPDDKLPLLYRVADVAAFPSLYEPFGIVALEAMAAGVPVVVSDVGGFSSIVQHDVNGVKHYPDNPDSLGWAILHVLMDPENSKKLVNQASQDVVTKYNWTLLAQQTRQVYNEVLREASGQASGEPAPRKPGPRKGRATPDSIAEEGSA